MPRRSDLSVRQSQLMKGQDMGTTRYLGTLPKGDQALSGAKNAGLGPEDVLLDDEPDASA